MCGVFGAVTGQPIDDGLLVALRGARDTLTHRGPDFSGEWSAGQVYLGHTRLAILDLAASGNQPMVSADATNVLVVNGEIYNFRALRAQLEARHQFFSNSDSEVLLHGYREWGLAGLLDRIEGMYAFALLDTAARRIFLARDRVGIKPLYFSYGALGFAFASELKALRR